MKKSIVPFLIGTNLLWVFAGCSDAAFTATAPPPERKKQIIKGAETPPATLPTPGTTTGSPPGDGLPPPTSTSPNASSTVGGNSDVATGEVASTGAGTPTGALTGAQGQQPPPPCTPPATVHYHEDPNWAAGYAGWDTDVPLTATAENCPGTNQRRFNGTEIVVRYCDDYTKFIYACVELSAPGPGVCPTYGGFQDPNWPGVGGHTCFDPSTLIRLGDGSSVPISRIRVGDRVWNPLRGRSNQVTKVTQTNLRGMAGSLVRIRTVAGDLRVTPLHPLLTTRGVKTAAEITILDTLLSDGGRTTPVRAVQTIKLETLQAVLNLTFDLDSANPEDHAVLAEGVAAGDEWLSINHLVPGAVATTGKQKTAPFPVLTDRMFASAFGSVSKAFP